MQAKQHVLVTGGAGYIGSLLVGELLRTGHLVTVVDDLFFGGEPLLTYMAHPNFAFIKDDVWEPQVIIDAAREDWPQPNAIVHLAAIVGFPACQAIGQQVAWRYNVEATQRVFEQGVEIGVKRFIFASTYSNYGLSADGEAVTEDSQLQPQSLYAETKVAAEEYLVDQRDSPCAPIIFRFATLYGISPRTRFDLIVNQFVLDALLKRELLIYQRGYSRSFVHVYDVVRGILLALEAPESKLRGQIFNLGTDEGNFTKDEIVEFILKHLPETAVKYKDITFGGDMRDIRVSFKKIHDELGFKTTLTVEEGIEEVLNALKTGLIKDPLHPRYRNARFIVS
jgi:nucleoside-diphosphate-sugar epimerase